MSEVSENALGALGGGKIPPLSQVCAGGERPLPRSCNNHHPDVRRILEV